MHGPWPARQVGTQDPGDVHPAVLLGRVHQVRQHVLGAVRIAAQVEDDAALASVAAMASSSVGSARDRSISQIPGSTSPIGG